METQIEISLRGTGGEPVDPWYVIRSHGIAALPPARVDAGARALETTLALADTGPRALRFTADGSRLVIESRDGNGPLDHGTLASATRRMFVLDDDLGPFYLLASADPELEWAMMGAGRMLRSQTVFEDVVKTICTTNCAWSATQRMSAALVEHLGEAVRGTSPDDSISHAFPTAEAMAAVDESFYRDTVRAGYRSPHFHRLATAVAAGETDLESLLDPELPESEVERRLLALPGVGSYASAQIQLLLGRYSRLVLDSWSRPKYASLRGRRASDKTIARRYRRYGRYAGLAFWLYVSGDWVTR